MHITTKHVAWWTAKLHASDRADVKLFYLDFTRQKRAEHDEATCPDPLGLLAADHSDSLDADDSALTPSPSPAAASAATQSEAHAPSWALSRLLWAARLISCDERTLWECVGARFQHVFDHRVDSWNEQLAVKLVHYFLDTFRDEDVQKPRLSTRLASYASTAIAPLSAQLTACGGLQGKLDALAATAAPTAAGPTTGSIATSAAIVVPMEEANDYSEGCLACGRAVPPFGELLRIPRDAMFFRETVLAHCVLGRAMQQQAALFDSILSNEEALLVLSLVFEKNVVGAQDSHWSQLLRGCPASYPTVPAFWDFSDLAALEGTDVLDDVVTKKTELQLFHEQVLAALPTILEALQRAAHDASTSAQRIAALTLEDLTTFFSYDALLWARATFDSRAFKLNIDGTVRLALVPVADMINHDNRSDVLIRRVEDLADGGDFVMQVGAAVTDASVRHRRELWMSYGPLQNWELLQFYGFVLSHNEHDKLPFPFAVPEPVSYEPGAVSALEEMETEAERLLWWQRRRQELMDRYSLYTVGRCWVRASGVPSEALLALLRVHLAQAEEFAAIDANGPFSPLSPATEVSVVNAVRETVECVLALFSTTLEEDDEELRELSTLTQAATAEESHSNKRTANEEASPAIADAHNDEDNNADKAGDKDENDEDEDDEDDPHAWENYILSLRLRLELKRIAQRTLKWCSAQDTV